MRPRTDVLAIGETMAMVTPTAPSAIGGSTAYLIRPGGAESNVAVHLARLGHQSMWAGLVGEDPLGRLLLDELAAAGVDVSLAASIPGRPTGLYLKHIADGVTSVLYYRSGSAASTMDRRLLSELEATQARVVHMTGITPALSASCLDLTRAIVLERRLDCEQVTFDINYRAQLWESAAVASRSLLELAQQADVVFVGQDEAHTLWGCRTPEEVRDVLSAPPRLVVKDGGRGATELDGTMRVFAPAPRVEVVETVGAGDAFAAGWISGWLLGADAMSRLSLGHAVAGSVLTTTFDDVDLPADLHISRRAAPTPVRR